MPISSILGKSVQILKKGNKSFSSNVCQLYRIPQLEKPHSKDNTGKVKYAVIKALVDDKEGFSSYPTEA